MLKGSICRATVYTDSPTQWQCEKCFDLRMTQLTDRAVVHNPFVSQGSIMCYVHKYEVKLLK